MRPTGFLLVDVQECVKNPGFRLHIWSLNSRCVWLCASSMMNNWDPSKKPQRFQWRSRPQVLLRLVFLDSRMSKCVIQDLGRLLWYVCCWCGCFFFCNFPPAIIVFFWLCFMLSKAHFNSIHYITQMTFKEFQTLPKKHDIARALKNINTFSAEKKMAENKTNETHRCFLLWIFPGGSILQTTGQGSFRRRLHQVDGFLRV